MTQTRIEGDVYINGTLIPKVLVPSSGCVLNEHIGAAAALDPEKMKRRFRVQYTKPGTGATETAAVHECQSANGGTIELFGVGARVVPTGDYTLTVDLLKAGVSVLSAAVVLNSSSTARTMQFGTVSSATLADGDWLDVEVTAAGASGTQGSGLLVTVEVEEEMS